MNMMAWDSLVVNLCSLDLGVANHKCLIASRFFTCMKSMNELSCVV